MSSTSSLALAASGLARWPPGRLDFRPRVAGRLAGWVAGRARTGAGGQAGMRAGGNAGRQAGRQAGQPGKSGESGKPSSPAACHSSHPTEDNMGNVLRSDARGHVNTERGGSTRAGSYLCGVDLCAPWLTHSTSYTAIAPIASIRPIPKPENPLSENRWLKLLGNPRFPTCMF